MSRPLCCESTGFIQNVYCYCMYDNETWGHVINTNYFKKNMLVWIELFVPDFGMVKGTWLRRYFKNIRHRNLKYEFNGKTHRIRDIIHRVVYLWSNVEADPTIPKNASDITLNFEDFVPIKSKSNYHISKMTPTRTLMKL